LATKDDLVIFATKADLANFATRQDLANFATKQDLAIFATKQDLATYATKQDLKEGLDELRMEFRDTFATKQELAEMRDELRQDIRREGVDTRRHFDVVAEAMHDDVRIIAEGLVALERRVTRLERKKS
jgi:hypothetical protein